MHSFFAGPTGKARAAFLLLLLIAAGCGLMAGREYWILQRIEAYQPAPCLIDECVMDPGLGTDAYNRPAIVHTPQVKFHYEVGGQTYHGTAWTRHPGALYGEKAITEFQARYGAGASAECYYDPADPDDAVLVKPTDDAADGWLKAMAICGGLAVIGWGAVELAGGRTAVRPPGRRSLSWGAAAAGPNDPLARTRRMYREKLES